MSKPWELRSKMREFGPFYGSFWLKKTRHTITLYVSNYKSLTFVELPTRNWKNVDFWLNYQKHCILRWNIKTRRFCPVSWSFALKRGEIFKNTTLFKLLRTESVELRTRKKLPWKNNGASVLTCLAHWESNRFAFGMFLWSSGLKVSFFVWLWTNFKQKCGASSSKTHNCVSFRLKN